MSPFLAILFSKFDISNIVITNINQGTNNNESKIQIEDNGSETGNIINPDTQLIYNCIQCNSEVSKTCRNFMINHLCRTCIINNKPIPVEKSLLYLEPIVALLWHPTKNTKSPKDYKRQSMKKVWWLWWWG